MTKEKQTQTNDILKYMKKHKSGITSKKAFEMFGATRLAAIIYRLRKHYDIRTILEEETNRYGSTTTYARYVFKGDLQ